MDFRKWVFQSLAASILLLVVGITAALASTGAIDATNHYAWSDNGGYINWNATGGNVTVSDAALTGYIWSASFGWINLSPTQGGVSNNAGVLGGYAWGANTGWINFDGVTIDSNGGFHGQTTPQSLFGTMTFDCTYCNVTTSWRNSSIAPSNTITGGGGTVSGSQSYGHQGAAASSSPILIPTTPPPKVQPPSAPGTTSPPAHLTPSITFTIYTAPSAVVGNALVVNVRFSATKRTQIITMAYRLYSLGGKTVYSAKATLTPTSPASFAVSIPTVGLGVGTYTVAVSAQYGKQSVAAQTVKVGLYSTKNQAAKAETISPYTQKPSCSPFTCWWDGIVSFLTHLF